MNQRERQMQINDGLRELFNPLDRKLVGFIPVRTNQRREHFLKICEVCYNFMSDNPDGCLLVDAKLKGGINRPDILILFPEKKIIEVVCTESDESIEDKTKRYPIRNIEIVRCDE